MAFLRHAGRHVHHTVANHIETQLGVLNWTTVGNVPFDSPPVQVRRTSAIVGGTLGKTTKAGTVAVTLGNEFASDPEELGGPLSSQEYPIFIDVFQDTEATTLALALDVKDILMGRFPNTSRFLPVIDQTTGTPVDGWKIEFDDVERVEPDYNFALFWQVVKVTAVAYFPEVIY